MMSQEQFYLLAAKILNSEASEQERHEFEVLVNSSDAWREQFRNLEEIWNASHPKQYQPEHTEDAYMMHLARLKDSVHDFNDHTAEYQAAPDEDFKLYPVKSTFKRWYAVAAAAIIAVGAFGLYFWQKPSQANPLAVSRINNEINVKKGAKTKLQLPDGSHVWVNSDSKLSYAPSFQGKFREVFLEGEAYFDVVKDPAHPFIVHTNGIDVRVLGTAFNVKAYDGEPTIEATLVHGQIEVTNTLHPDAPKVLLKHHEKLIFNRLADQPVVAAKVATISTPKPAITIAQIAKQTPDSAFVETAWVYNRLRFDEESFDELALKMERWFDVEIKIDNEKIRSMKLTGSFENETVEEALKELQYLVAFDYSINNREIVIRKKK